MDVLNELLGGFATALSPQNLLFAFIGCLVGTLIGVLPGIGPVAGVALLIPLTFNLEPASAASSEMPTTIRAKNSGGPIFRPREPSGLAAMTSPTVAMTPPTNEPTAAMVSAAPARPCFVIS